MLGIVPRISCLAYDQFTATEDTSVNLVTITERAVRDL